MSSKPDSHEEDFRIDYAGASVRKQIESKLRRAITNGYFRPGDHLSDRKLTAMFDVSRSVVREAVRQMEAEGLVATAPNRGAFVKLLTTDEVRQIYDVRGVLEALAARKFSENASERDLVDLEAVYVKLQRSAERENPDGLIELKQEFYSVLIRGSKNLYIRDMLNQLLNRNSQLRATTLSDPTRLHQTIAELSTLMEAIRRRDGDAAWEASAFHVRKAAEKALSILDDHEEKTS